MSVKSLADMCLLVLLVVTLQHIAELRISNLATNLRKHVIFESSALANEQVRAASVANA